MLQRIAIMLAAALIMSPSAARGEDVTFSKQVAPILWNNCASCHRPGEIGPFPLLTYKDAKKHASFIKEITQDHRMPPWKPEAHFGDFRNVRRLSDDDIRTLARWADAGAPEGDPKNLPAMPHFPEGWQLGKPDLVLTMPTTFNIPASGRDVYRNFIIKIPIDKDRTVAATEFRPGNRRVVHHALFFLDGYGQARARDGEDGKPGYSTFGGLGILPSGGLGGWAPGTIPRMLPEGTGMFLAKGSDLVVQIHYHPDGKEETDLSSVGVYFTKKPATTIVGGIAVRSRGLDIPAGDSHFAVHAESQPFPVDVKSLAIFPHMHNIGREMKVIAYPPTGSPIPMIWIRDWDFNWQGAYVFREPVSLPKGTVLKVDAIYDNSSDNPKNPSDPPKRVRWGEQTTDEMCICGMTVVTKTAADLRQVRMMNFAQLGAILGGGVLPTERGEKPGQSKAQNMSPVKLDDAARKKILAKIPADGFPIPEMFRERLAPFDRDHDGRLSAAEIEAMPEPARSRVLEAVRKMVDK